MLLTLAEERIFLAYISEKSGSSISGTGIQVPDIISNIINNVTFWVCFSSWWLQPWVDFLFW